MATKITESTPEAIRDPMQAAADERSWREFQTRQRLQQAKEEKYQEEDKALFTMLQQAEIRKLARQEAKLVVEQNAEYAADQDAAPRFNPEVYLNMQAQQKPVQAFKQEPLQVEIVRPGLAGWLGWAVGIIGTLAAAIVAVLRWV